MRPNRKGSGRKVTLGDAIERSLDSLEDAHRRGAWLSPREIGPVVIQRTQNAIAAVLGQVVPQVAGCDIEQIEFADARKIGPMVLHLADGRTIEFRPVPAFEVHQN